MASAPAAPGRSIPSSADGQPSPEPGASARRHPGSGGVPRIALRLAGGIVLTLAASRCASRSDSADPVATRDSTGALTVRLTVLQQAATPEWRTTTLFTTRAIDTLHLGYYVDARLLPDSSLLLSATSRLFLLNPDGSVRRIIGREGNGPGEYQRITRLAIAADGRILVGDYGSGPGASRLTILRPDGSLQRIIRTLGPVGAIYEMDPIALLSDGSVLATYWQRRPNREEPGMPSGEFGRDSAPLIVFDSIGRERGRLGLWRGLERVPVGLGNLVPRFGHTTVYRASGEYALIGATDSLDLSLYIGRRLGLRLTGPRVPRTPTADDDRRWRQALKEHYADVAETYLSAVAEGPTVGTLPTVGAALADDTGNLWVGAFTLPRDSLRTWQVFSPSGVPLGHLELPAHDDPMIPGTSELLDVRSDRLVLLREEATGDVVVEVRRILH